MKKQIAIDARWLRGGIGTYTEHLLEGLAKSCNGFEVSAITTTKNLMKVSQWCHRLKIVDSTIYSIMEQLKVPFAAKDADLLHVPHYNVPLLHTGRLVVSILDVIHLTDPTYRKKFSVQAYARPMLKLAAKRADQIVTISNFSKMQIVENLGVPPEKVTTIHCGASTTFQPSDKEVAANAISRFLNIDQPFVLYVGNLKPHKNVPTLLRAFAAVRKRIAPFLLVIVSENKEGSAALRSETTQLGIENVTQFIPHVPRELLASLYAAAAVLVMPSRIEGFGLPVLEAMASGTPVICSRSASLPEVAEDAAVYFDASAPDELSDAILRVLSSTEIQRDLRAKGLARARQLTWQRSVEQHLSVYEEVLERR
jgi:glycosyltransferase involved in cell wall biosynthesis